MPPGEGGLRQSCSRNLYAFQFACAAAVYCIVSGICGTLIVRYRGSLRNTRCREHIITSCQVDNARAPCSTSSPFLDQLAVWSVGSVSNVTLKGIINIQLPPLGWHVRSDGIDRFVHTEQRLCNAAIDWHGVLEGLLAVAYGWDRSARGLCRLCTGRKAEGWQFKRGCAQ